MPWHVAPGRGGLDGKSILEPFLFGHLRAASPQRRMARALLLPEPMWIWLASILGLAVVLAVPAWGGELDRTFAVGSGGKLVIALSSMSCEYLAGSLDSLTARR